MPTVKEMADRILSGGQVGRDEALWLATEADFHELVFCADGLRRHFCGDEIHLCSIINAKSGSCSEDCRFCAQSARHHTGIRAYPLVSEERMVSAAVDAARRGADCFGIVTSGERTAGNSKDFDAICSAAGAIASSGALERSCVSIGRLGPDEVARLKAAGLRRIHHNLETSARFFPQVCTTHSREERVRTVRNVKEAGLEACCGGLFGMGETWEDRVDLALDVRELDADAVPMNFLNPIPGTPLGTHPLLPPREALRIIGLFRFLLPRKQIQVCGGRTVTLRDMQSWMFMAGASGLMTGDYLTTRGRSPDEDLRMLADLGLKPCAAGKERRLPE